MSLRIPVAVMAAVAWTVVQAAGFRLDVSVQPDGAKVWVDGKECGIAPCSSYDLGAGRHWVHVEAKGYDAVDDFAEVGDDAPFVRKNFVLSPTKALILVKTDPPGADVKYGGVSIGRTPLLVTSLASDTTHTLELSLNGYRTRKIDVHAEGRAPQMREEKLAPDSGTVECKTEPAGATVFVNGVERGVTPIEISGVPKGLATVTFKLEGYADETRELRLVPGERQTLALRLKGRPGQLTVVTYPEGAKVFIDGNYQGKSPVTASSVEAGSHEVRVELAGHAAVKRTVQTVNGGVSTEEFRLESVMGRLEVITIPAGAKISVDGKARGFTRGGSESAKSQVFAIENIPAGEHAVMARLDGYQDVSRKVVVGAKGTKQLYIRMARSFVPDTEVETINGAPVRGVMVPAETDPLKVTLEIKPGVMRSIPRETIRKITPLK